MTVTYVHCADWYIPVGDDARDVLGNHKLPVCSQKEADWEAFKNKAVGAGLRIQVYDITGKTTAADIIKGRLDTCRLSKIEEPVAAKPEPVAAKPEPVAAKEDDGFFPVSGDSDPFPVIGDQT